MKHRSTIGIVLALATSSGCAEDHAQTDDASLEDAASAVGSASGSAGNTTKPRVVECDQQPDGTPCGPPGRGTHCITETCVDNACGDGIRAELEECDDGNQGEGDGCSARCTHMEGGVPTLGGSTSEGGASAADAASGDAAVRASDGGGTDSGRDAGGGGMMDASTPVDAGAKDASRSFDANITRNEAGLTPCEECRNRECRADKNPDGIDVTAGCLEAIQTDFVPAGNQTPQFIQECMNVVSCAHQNVCAYMLPWGPTGCYCGSAEPTACVMVGPAADAPCRSQWEAATRATDNPTIQARITLIDYPSGWAYALLQCEGSACLKECDGPQP